MTKAITRHAYAKLNLALSVGAPIEAGLPGAGFHPIASWFAPIDLCDDVTVEHTPGADSSLHVGWAPDAPRPSPIDWAPEKDLALRAVRALEAFAGRALGVRVTVRKRIPVGGGLGGGSSDAAATMLASRELFALNITDDSLAELAMGLGSDVAYFTRSSPVPPHALVTGMGERVEALEPVRGEVLLVIPAFGCPTGPVYQAFDRRLEEEMRHDRVKHALEGGRGRDFGAKPALVRRRHAKCLREGALVSAALFNDLTIGAYTVEPRLGSLANAVSGAARATAHVTGSGSCLFFVGPATELDGIETRVRRMLAGDDVPDWREPGEPVVLRVKVL